MNVCTFPGRLTADAEVRFTAGGDPVASFTVANDVGYGEKKHALFVRCSLWGKRAEALAPHLLKGVPVTVSGEADLRTWEANGKSGTSLELRVSDLALQGGKRTEEKPQGFREPKAEAPAADFDDSDIPFVWILPAVLGASYLAGQVAVSVGGIV